MKKFKDFTEKQKTNALVKALDLGCDLEDQAQDLLKMPRMGSASNPGELKELLKKKGSKECLELLSKIKENDDEINYLFL